MTLHRRLRELEQRAATVPVNPAQYHAAAARQDARLLAFVRGFLAAIREGGKPLPREITAEMEQDRATVMARCTAGEVERDAGRFHLLMARTAANLRESIPVNEARLAPADHTLARADADIEHTNGVPTTGTVALSPTVPVERAISSRKIWNLSGEIPRRGRGPHWLRPT